MATSYFCFHLIMCYKEWPTTMIIVSHDRNFLTSVCTDILHLTCRQIDAYRGDFEQFLVTKEERLKHRIKEYEAQLQYREHIQVAREVLSVDSSHFSITDEFYSLLKPAH